MSEPKIVRAPSGRYTRLYPAPHPGSVTALGNPAPDVLIISNGGDQIEFNIGAHEKDAHPKPGRFHRL